MTNDETQRDTDEARDAQGLPDEGPGSKSAPPSNPEVVERLVVVLEERVREFG